MRWWERLEVRVLLIAIVLPLLGVVSVSLGVMHLMRQGLLDAARRQSTSAANLINSSLERVMLEGRADITRALVADLRAQAGVIGVDVLSSEGREAFAKDGAPTEAPALARLRATRAPFSVEEGERLLFYRPLLNGERCRGCHADDGELLGATKVTLPLEETLPGGSELVAAALAWSLAGVLAMGLLFWWLIRILVVRPVASMRAATGALAVGDLTIDVPGTPRGELGALWRDLRDSVRALGAVIGRIHEVAARVADAAGHTERESAAVVESASLEADSFASIASSIEELDASIGQIAADTDGLAEAADTVHAATKELAVNTAEVLRRTEELTGSVTEVSSTAVEMSHTIRELTWGAEHLTGVSTETLAAVRDVDEVIRAVESGARAAAASSGRVRAEAEELGLRAVRRTLEGMQAVRQAVERGAAAVQALGKRSGQIGEILDVIDEVNERTALLSLNAAILAAQAGEQGRGFQVVAREIRALAVKTGRSTVEITELITAIRAEVADAVEAMRAGLAQVEAGFGYAREAGGALEKIVESAAVSLEKSAAIEGAAQTQTHGLARVREAMGRLDQMAQFLAQGTAEQKREADRIRDAMEQVADATRHIRAANAEQALAGGHVAAAAETVSAGVGRMSQALQEQRAGCRQIRTALAPVVDLPGRNRALALRINQGLRGITADTDLLNAEVARFTVLPEQARGVLLLGVVPLESPAVMHRRFTPLAAHLGRAVGQPVELKVAPDFAAAVRDLGEGRTQLAFLTPSTYVLAHGRHGARLLATALRRGQPVQHSVIVARRDAGIRTLNDLKGRSFAFGDVDSTSSHIVPRAMLLDAGVPLELLAASAHLGHHDAVAAAVLHGEYDAGAVMESVAARHERDGLVAVAVSPAIPEFNISAARDLDPGLAERLQRALLGLSRATPEGAAVLEALAADYTGFAAAADADYETVRTMLRRLGMLPPEAATPRPAA